MECVLRIRAFRFGWSYIKTACMRSIHMHVQLKLKLKSQRALGTLNKDWRWTNRLTPIEHRRCQPSDCLPRAPEARDVRTGRHTYRLSMPLSAQHACPPQRSPPP